MKKTVSLFVIVMLVFQSFVLAEPSEAEETVDSSESWLSQFFQDFFGERENIAAQASCSGFWQCFWGRENVVGKEMIKNNGGNTII